jgi:hypothetical protein
MTITEVRPAGLAPVVLATADGETRAAKMWGLDSYSCAFCDSPVFGPQDWEAHEQANADHYAKQGEAYTWEPYSYRAKYWEARECANPGCVVWFSGDRLAGYRKREADRKRYEDEQAREAQREQDKRDAQAAQAARAAKLHANVGPVALQLGFAWCCTKTTPAESYGADPVMCEESGTDRGEYEAHMRGHGARAYHGTKRIRLRRKPPAATMRKLDVPVTKWLRWDEDHREPGTCTCGHLQTVHRSSYSATGEDVKPGCDDCTCTTERCSIQPDVTTATRRGQFWSEGSRPHSFWVLPFEPAPWEDGQAAPVMLSRHWTGHGWTVASTGSADVVRRAENVRRRGVFAIRTGEGSLGRGYYRASAYDVHTDPECAAADGWRESDRQPYDVWAVVDQLTGRSQGDSDHKLCPRCILLEDDAAA